jgi:hypothetical protein
VEDQHVAVRILDEAHVADAGVLDPQHLRPGRPKLLDSRLDVGDAKREAGDGRLESLASSSGFQNASVTLGVSSSYGANSLAGSPRTSRYHAIARSALRVGMETKSTCSTCN